MKFVHLHTHTPFSFLDGASSIEDMVNQAAGLDMPALAITDHDNVCAAVKFAQAALKAGIKPIQGVEITMAGGHHLTLLARNSAGYASICSLLTHACLSNPHDTPQVHFQDLKKLKQVIVLSGCRRGELASLILKGQYKAAAQRVGEYLSLMGRDNFYIELQNNRLPGDQYLNHCLIELAGTFDIQPVAGNNVHYAEHDDFMLHDILTCVRTLSRVRDINAWRPFNGENFLKSSPQMQQLFPFCPQAIENSWHIAQQCEPVIKLREPHFPSYTVPDGPGAPAMLRRLTLEGAHRRYGRINQAVAARLEHELNIIEQMGFAGYFLLVWDLACFARRQGIRYAGRGSAADSLVVYCLYITEVDSLDRGLLFERFMSPERADFPDIDIDFESRYRDRVIDYIYKKYGSDKVARVAAYNTFRARSALRDLGKALGFDEKEIGAIARKLPHTYADNIRGMVNLLPELKDTPLEEERFQFLLDMCARVAGYPRFLSMHLGGVVISDVPLMNLTPLQQSALGPVMCQFDKDDVEDLGLVKLDLLPLRTLSVVQDATHIIAENGEVLDYDGIPPDDEATYKLINRGETIGVFQIESPAQRALQTRLGAQNMEDMIASMALIRPGPIKGNMVEPYIARRQGQQEVAYLHPLLEPILKKTYGVVLFQEQVIEIAQVIAGFTPGEADQLRRVMTHARSQKTMEEIGLKFIDRSVENGISRETAQQIFSCILGYASYGFCEAHAAAFAGTSYKTAYLVRHYPAQYYTAILNNQPMGYYPSHVICNEARRRGISILPADINQSEVNFTVAEKAIRVGLKQIKGMTRLALESIINARREKDFISPLDFLMRTDVRLDIVENLIKCGALDSLHSNRRWLLNRLPFWMEKKMMLKNGESMLFDIDSEADVINVSSEQCREWEYSILGIDIRNHLMTTLRENLQKRKIYSSRDLSHLPSGALVQVAGLLLNPHRPPTRSGRITVFFSLEDEFGLTDVTVFEDIYMRHGGCIFGRESRRPVLVKGLLQRRGQGESVVARYIGDLKV